MRSLLGKLLLRAQEFELFFDYFLSYYFVLGVLFKELVDGRFFLLLDIFQLFVTIFEDLLDFRVQIFKI